MGFFFFLLLSSQVSTKMLFRQLVMVVKKGHISNALCSEETICKYICHFYTYLKTFKASMTLFPYIAPLKTFFQPMAVPASKTVLKSFVGHVNSPYTFLQTDYTYSYQKTLGPLRSWYLTCFPCAGVPVHTQGYMSGLVFS